MSKKHRKHEEHEEHADESWLIPYADLLTLLLALFIVLFAASSVDVKKFQDMSRAFSIAFNTGSGVLDQSSVITSGKQFTSKDREHNSSQSEGEGGNAEGEQEQELDQQQLAQKEQQDLENLKQQVDEYIQQNGLSEQLETILNLSELLITIRDNALFDSGKADIKQESRELGTAIANMLAMYPDYEIIVAGHTDNQPISTYEFESNWELSAKRAIRFMNVLLQNDKLDVRKIGSTGYAEFRPVDTNDTAEGRARNRRVEVSIIRKYAHEAKVAEQTISVQ